MFLNLQIKYSNNGLKNVEIFRNSKLQQHAQDVSNHKSKSKDTE